MAGRWYLCPNPGKILSQKKLEIFAIFSSEAAGKAVHGGDALMAAGVAKHTARYAAKQAGPLSLEEAEYLISCMLPCIYIA